jgi:hypothetical protein
MTSVFIVCVSDAEANSIISVHKTYGGALKSWNEERKRIIKEYKRMKFLEVSRGWSHEYDNSYNRNIANLLCEDPTKIDNFPLDTPHIHEYELLP